MEKPPEIIRSLLKAVGRRRKDRWTWQYYGRLVKSGWSRWDIAEEYLNVVLQGYASADREALWKLWNSIKMKRNYTEAANMKAAAIEKEAGRCFVMSVGKNFTTEQHAVAAMCSAMFSTPPRTTDGMQVT